MKKIRLLSLLLTLLTSPLFAQFDYGFDFSKAGTSGFQFLKIGIGAEQIAMGDAAASTVSGVSSVYWNPAGLGWLEKRQVFAHQTNWLVDSKHSALALAFPFKSIRVAVNVMSLAVNEFEETTVADPLGTGRMVDAGDFMVGLAITRRYTDRLSIGAQVKFVQEKLDDVTFDNFLFDVGTIYYTGFRDLRLSFVLQHFGPDITVFDNKFKMPLLFRIGAADNLIDRENFRLIAAVDLIHPTDNNESVNWGMELLLMDALALRGGYRMNVDEGDLSLGAGLRTPTLSGFQTRVDYAYSSFGDVFGTIHRFSLMLEF